VIRGKSIGPKILPLHPAEDSDLKDDSKESRDNESDDKAEQPPAGGVDSQITEVTAEKVDRAVRQIDVSHEAENQGEAAGDEEIKAA
jgi:hypothetical protein